MDRTLEEVEREGVASASAPWIGLCLEGFRPWASGARWSLRGVNEVTLERGEERRTLREDGGARLRIQIPSPALSSVHARIVRDGPRFRVIDAGSRNGTFLEGKRVTEAPLSDASVVEVGRTFFSVHAGPDTAPPVDPLDAEALGRRPRGLRTLRPDLELANDALLRIARSDVPVLLLGASGVGKELVAGAVHAASERAGPLLPVNCAGIAPNLVEASFFGHVKGAFSGALRDEPGFFRAAHGGTLFLDEIGDLPLASQAALLRTLQEGEVMPVGSTRAVTVDVRVVAATHQPLDELVLAGSFRPDLLARLRGYTHAIAPLCERRQDLGVLLADILPALDAERAEAVVLSARVARALFGYPFPLNVRELYQALASALVLAPPGGPLEAAHFPARFFEAEGVVPASTPPPAPEDEELRRELVRALELHQGNVTHVAQATNRAPMQIYRWMRKLGIDPSAYRKPK